MHQRNSHNSATNFLSIYTKWTGKPTVQPHKLLIKKPPTNCTCGRKPMNTAAQEARKSVQPFVHVKDAASNTSVHIQGAAYSPSIKLCLVWLMLLAHIDTPPYVLHWWFDRWISLHSLCGGISAGPDWLKFVTRKIIPRKSTVLGKGRALYHGLNQ